MTKQMIWSLVGIFILVVVSVSQARVYELGKSASIHVVEGNMEGVYSDFITIATSPEEKSADFNNSDMGELRINVDSATHFEDFIKLSDLQEGERVRVTYQDNQDHGKVATMIEKMDDSEYEKTDRVTTITTTTTSYE